MDMAPISASLRYEDIAIGAAYSFERTIHRDDVFQFADLTGDHNPLHIDPAFGAQSRFGKNIVHGMLAASLFSTLVGMYCPGDHALYMSQTIQFRKPIFYGDQVLVKATVTAKIDALRMITMKTELIKDDAVVVSGEATVQVV